MIVNKLKKVFANKDLSEIITSSVWVLIARVLATALGFLGSIFLARQYGAETIGIIALINSFLMLTAIPSLLGLNTSIMKLIPKARVTFSPASSWSVYRKSLILVVAASTLVSTILYILKGQVVIHVFSKPHLELFIGLAAMFLVFKTLTIFSTQAIRALKKIKIFAFVQVLPQAVNLIFFIMFWFFFASDNAPIYAVFTGLVVTSLVGCLLVENSFLNSVERQRQPSPETYKTLLDTSLPMMMTGVISIISGQLGIIMLGVYGTEADIGIFAIVVKLATLTGFVLKALNTIVAPKIAELKYGSDEAKLFFIVKTTAKIIFWTTTPILMFLLVFGEQILVYFFGLEFKVGYEALCILVFGQFVNSISGCTGIFLNMTGDQRIYRNIIFFGAIVFICLNSILIPLYGMLGAALAIFITECIWNVSCLIYIKRKYGKTTSYLPI